MLEQFRWRLLEITGDSQLDQIIPDLLRCECQQYSSGRRIGQLECRANRQRGDKRNKTALPTNDGRAAIPQDAEQCRKSRTGYQLRHGFACKAQMIDTRQRRSAYANRGRSQVIKTGDFILNRQAARHQTRQIAVRETIWHADGARQVTQGRRLSCVDKGEENFRCLVSRLNAAPPSAFFRAVALPSQASSRKKSNFIWLVQNIR